MKGLLFDKNDGMLILIFIFMCYIFGLWIYYKYKEGEFNYDKQ